MPGWKALTRTRARPASPGPGPATQAQAASFLIARADAARDAGRFRDAAVLYDEALRLSPGKGGIHVQCGHMFKEAGELDRAEAHYREALRLKPDDPDLALQLGHFHKVAGRLRDAAASYRRALDLQPGWAAPAAELDALRRHGWQDPGAAQEEAGTDEREREARTFGKEAEELELAAAGRLLPEIVPRRRHEMLRPHGEGTELRRFGQRERTFWGTLPTFRGVAAIRGFCISLDPVTELQVLLNGLPIHRGPVRGGYELFYERDRKDRLLKYVFNVWLDFSPFARGRYDLELRFMRAAREPHVRREQVVIAEPLLEADYPQLDEVITLDPADSRPVEDQINTRPSVVRPAIRSVLDPAALRTVLVLRTDQLGDLIASIPALRRLRELLPRSRIVGLLTAGNADLARTLGLFDEIVVADYPDDLIDRKRTMPLRQQEELRQRLAAYQFDLALDLSEASQSRPLLLLSGAKFLCGFGGGDFPWLNAGFEAATPAPLSGREAAPHSSRVLALVERLGALLGTKAEVIRRPDLSRASLARYGLGEQGRYALLHTGARIGFSRWEHYAELARLLIERTDLTVVLVPADDPDLSSLPASLAQSARFRLVEGRLPWDDFDALVSFCAVYVGNDSGPKHLAALRGVPVVSIHSARIPWNEWGQELGGVVVSRKVPCAGCAIYFDPDECGQDYACVKRIGVEEVFAAVQAQLQAAVAPDTPGHVGADEALPVR